jgi:hypothetical protein
MNRLSHSALSKYQFCPTAYKYHYQDKLRPTITHAALLFGSAIDAALNDIMVKIGNTNINSVNTSNGTFSYWWKFGRVNNETINLTSCTDIVYANADFDHDLLNEEDYKKIREKIGITTNKTLLDEYSKIFKRKEYSGFNFLSTEEKVLLNLCNWYSMHHKGLIMLDSVRKKIVPHIKEVLAIQPKVELKNDHGDIVTGIADLVCLWKDISEPIIFDWKTSSREYDKDSVLVSPQLSLYMHALFEEYKTRRAGFIVLNKHIIKNKQKICSACQYDGTGFKFARCSNVDQDRVRCNGEWNIKINPEAYIQVIIDNIPKRTEDIVLENYDYINQSIKSGVFPRNLNSCISSWGKCEFWNKCYHDNNKGLIKL